MLEIKNQKLPSVNTQKSRLLKTYGFERFPIKPWDDYGYYRKTQYNYYQYIVLYKDYKYFDFELIGDDFLRQLRVSVAIPEDISDEKEKMAVYCQYTSIFLDQFQNEILPKYVEIFGNSSDLFVLNSAQARMGNYLRFIDHYAINGT